MSSASVIIPQSLNFIYLPYSYHGDDITITFRERGDALVDKEMPDNRIPRSPVIEKKSFEIF